MSFTRSGHKKIDLLQRTRAPEKRCGTYSDLQPSNRVPPLACNTVVFCRPSNQKLMYCIQSSHFQTLDILTETVTKGDKPAQHHTCYTPNIHMTDITVFTRVPETSIRPRGRYLEGTERNVPVPFQWNFEE